MIHILAISVCEDYILKLIDNFNIEQTLDVEQDTDDNSKDESFEFSELDERYLDNSLNNFIYHHYYYLQDNLKTISFQYFQIALPQRISEILIPPPRA